MSAAIAVEQLSVRFQRWGQTVQAIDQISLEIRTGSWVALVGHNGSGKSTLLRAIAGLQPVDSGTISVGGKPLSQLSPHRRAAELFLVHQNPLLGTAPLLTLAENLRVATNGRDEMGVLDAIGLASRAHQPAQLLSGGERQLLALAIAQRRAPRVLLLDEPFSALDPAREAQSLAMLSAARDSGTTIVQITHQLERLGNRPTRVVTLDQGKLIDDWTSPHADGASG